jgi:ligand-binding sensor domain-containing protein
VRWLLFLLFYSYNLAAQNLTPSIGSWREHLPYSSAIDVTASGQKVYAATPYSLFSVDVNTKEIQRFSRTSGLSETGISTIHYNKQTSQLWIGYTNSNIDVADSKGIHNIPELKRENAFPDKTIYHFFTDNQLAYASTAMGVIVLNGTKYEISDSWIIGRNGQPVRTYMFTKDAGFMYAATEEGLKKTPVSNNNPADFRTWQTISGSNGLSASSSKGVLNLSGKIIALQNDSLFIQNGNTWAFFFHNNLPITSINESENKLSIAQRIGNTGQVVILNSDGSVFRTIQNNTVASTPLKAVTLNGKIWIADEKAGLSEWSNASYELHNPNSPASVARGEMISKNNVLYVTAGGVTNSWSPLQNTSGYFRYEAGIWTNFNSNQYPQLAGFKDVISVAIDPRDEAVWLGSFGDGLLRISNNNQFQVFKQPPLAPALNAPGSYRISGLAFDQNNHLWVSNFGATPYLHVLKSNNTWQSFTAPFTLTGNAVSKILIDDADQKWIISPLGNGLLAFNHGNSIDDKGDDKWKLFKAGAGNGNLPSNNVLSIIKDKSGYLWVGTSDGIGIIQCPAEVFTTGCEATLPIAQQGNFANYLFKGEEVKTIAVDAADRKWVGTKNGVWLLSTNGEKIIERFTENNSPLPSNDVNEITMHHSTGEVFISTAKGLISYRGTASEGVETFKNLMVFPNPVPPGYNGPIAVKGLMENSFVKITELNGRLVYQTRSLGGQAIWNGKDLKGNTISTGVYLVLVTDAQQQDRAAGKIVFISK